MALSINTYGYLLALLMLIVLYSHSHIHSIMMKLGVSQCIVLQITVNKNQKFYYGALVTCGWANLEL